MTIVLPIFFAAVGFGLFVRKMTPMHWAALICILIAVIAYNFVKRPKLPPGATLTSTTSGDTVWIAVG